MVIDDEEERLEERRERDGATRVERRLEWGAVVVAAAAAAAAGGMSHESHLLRSWRPSTQPAAFLATYLLIYSTLSIPLSLSLYSSPGAVTVCSSTLPSILRVETDQRAPSFKKTHRNSSILDKRNAALSRHSPDSALNDNLF